jgi:TonB family protein
MKLLVFVGIFAISLFVWSCTPTTKTTKTAIDYSVNSPVKWEFETGSNVVFKTYNTSLEKTTDGTFIYKKYYPTTSVKTFEINYLDKERTIKQGRFTHRYDNGNIWSTGDFIADEENGEWRYYDLNGNLNKVGSFENGLPTGTWQTFSDSLLKASEYSFNNKGELHGKYIYYDKKGEVTKEITYEDGEVIKTKTYNEAEALERYEIVEKMPVYGEECGKIEDALLAKACGEKALLNAIYTNIRYPTFCRENGIEGTAYLEFVVEKDGTVSNVTVLNGVSEEIGQECLKVIDSLDSWQPGYQNGEAVRVQFRLPIRFRLE